MSDKPKTVLIGMPCGSGMVPVEMVKSLLSLHKPANSGLVIVERQRTDKARNALVAQALQGGFDYLFMVDDDNPIPEDTLEKFLEDDKDVVIAPILSRTPDPNGNFKLCAFYEDVRDCGDLKLRLYHNIQQFRDEGPLHRIDAGGTGAMLIKRQVLESLVEKFDGEPFGFGEIKLPEGTILDGKPYKKRTMSEDVEFCERAVDAGFQIWLDERIRPVHLGQARQLRWMP